MKDIKNIEALFSVLKLANLKCEPKNLKGGLLHHMYRVDADKTYAVKVLNPSIMKRETAYGNYVFSEKFTTYAVAKGIEGIPALEIDGDFIHQINEAHIMIFDWFDGVSGEAIEIGTNECIKIGHLLGDLHNLAYETSSIKNETITPIDWSYYLDQLKDHNYDWKEDFLAQVKTLEVLNDKLVESLRRHPNNVNSHRDLNPKNTMWDNKMNPMIIDWESSGPVNDMVELLEVLLDWSKGGQKQENFKRLLLAYNEKRYVMSEDLVSAMYCILDGKFNWLAYNLRRALYIECANGDEANLGSSQVVSTLKSINKYIKQMEDIKSLILKSLDRE